MMVIMTTIPDLQLNCLPWPKNAAMVKTPSQPAPSSQPTVFEFVGSKNSDVLCYAEKVLAAYRLGPISIEVLESGDAAVPMWTMDESYELEVTNNRVGLRAGSKWGALRGISTLAQLARHAQVLPGLSIEDSPRFPWRGLLLDVARHFFPIQSLKSVVDGLAMLKMNVLHLHLSDDQGFRFPSAAYPELASADHYTREELKALVGYAAERGVRIVPELDMPGHVTSWLVAYPQWGKRNICEPTQRFGVHKGCLNPLDENVYAAIETLLGELADIFPDDYVHVGGDEVSPDWWQQDPVIAEYLQQQGISTHDLQNEFLTRVCSLVRAKGKTPVGWDEVLHPDMPDCVVQNWRGATTRDRGLALGQPVLVSAPYYLDLHFPADMHYESDPELPQAEWLALEDSMQKDPRLSHVSEGIEWTKQWRQGAVDFAGDIRVMGGEACLWSELVTPEVLPTRLWSRLPAVAERLWSAADCTDMDSFYSRLQSCWLCLPEDPELTARRNLHALGLSGAQVDIASLLEPVKWYGRLLGQQALEARIAGSEMPKARPYAVTTPLDKVVDMLLPESMAARRLDDLTLAASANRVQELLLGLGDQTVVEELVPAIEALHRGAAIVASYAGGDATRDATLAGLEALDKPYGEYMAAPLVRWRWALSAEEASRDGRNFEHE
jgi:hexosaminidase